MRRCPEDTWKYKDTAEVKAKQIQKDTPCEQ